MVRFGLTYPIESILLELVGLSPDLKAPHGLASGVVRIFNLGGGGGERLSYSIYTILIIHKCIEFKVINSNISINYLIHYRHT